MFEFRSFARIAAVIFLAALFMSAGACKKKPAASDDKAAENAKIPHAENLGFKSEKTCKLNEVIEEPEKGTAEHALLHLFQVWKKAKDAKWSGANDEIFDEWRELFVRGTQENLAGQLKRALGSTLQKAKLEHFVSAETFAIIICKKQETGADGTGYRFYVRNDKPKSSNKPITVLKDESGKWKINPGSVLLY